MSGPIVNAADAVRELGALPVPMGTEPQALTPVLGMTLAELIGDVEAANPKLLLAFGESVRDCREHEHPKSSEDFHCLNLTAWMGERAALVLRRLLDVEAENSRLRARVAELEAERHSTNEALDDAVQALREYRQDGVYQQGTAQRVQQRQDEDPARCLSVHEFSPRDGWRMVCGNCDHGKDAECHREGGA